MPLGQPHWLVPPTSQTGRVSSRQSASSLQPTGSHSPAGSAPRSQLLLAQSPLALQPHTFYAVHTGRSGSLQSKLVKQPSTQVPEAPNPGLHTGVGLEQSPSPLGHPHVLVATSHTGCVGSWQSALLRHPDMQVPSGPLLESHVGRPLGQSTSPLGQPHSPLAFSHTGRVGSWHWLFSVHPSTQVPLAPSPVSQNGVAPPQSSSPFGQPHTLASRSQTGYVELGQSPLLLQPRRQSPAGSSPEAHVGVGSLQSPLPLGHPHSPEAVSHTGRAGSAAAQSASVWHSGSVQIPEGSALRLHFEPLGHWLLLSQPHAPSGMHTGCRGSTQSALEVQLRPQVPAGPWFLQHSGVGLEQSLSPLGQPHSFRFRLHAGRVGSLQSESSTHPSMQVPLGPSAGLQVARSLGQSMSPPGQPQRPVPWSHTGREASGQSLLLSHPGTQRPSEPV